jgi:hypothetical protein
MQRRLPSTSVIHHDLHPDWLIPCRWGLLDLSRRVLKVCVGFGAVLDRRRGRERRNSQVLRPARGAPSTIVWVVAGLSIGSSQRS